VAVHAAQQHGLVFVLPPPNGVQFVRVRPEFQWDAQISGVASASNFFVSAAKATS
jgi:hypothetical protein